MKHAIKKRMAAFILVLFVVMTASGMAEAAGNSDFTVVGGTGASQLGVDLQSDEGYGTLLAYFSFNNKNLTCDDGSAKATVGGGTASYSLPKVNNKTVKVTANGANSLYLNGSTYLKVTKADGNPLLTGYDEVVVDYWMYSSKADTQWAFYAAPNANGVTYKSKKYIAAFQNSETSVTAERYNSNNQDRPKSAAVNQKDIGTNKWIHVVVQYLDGETIVTVSNANGAVLGTNTAASSVGLADMLGKNSVLQIGRANWGNGEYYKGYIDEVKIYGKQIPKTPNVWFDGLDGDPRTGTSAYRYGAQNVRAELIAADNGYYVTLPDNYNVAKPSRYSFRLKGWYDVTHDVYYDSTQLGKTIPVTSDTVFYADWEAADYNFSDPNKKLATNVADTHEFVTNYFFDYNDLFNAYSAKLSSSSISKSGHSETWVRDNSSEINFEFMDWNFNGNRGTLAGNLIGTAKGSQTNYYNGYNSELGLLTNLNSPLASALFNPDDVRMGKSYAGSGDGLYLYDNDPKSEHYGYYYYDSKKNAAAFAGDHVEVYQEKEGAQSNHYDFLPFNSGKTVYDGGGETNYWFGMRSEVEFYLPDTPTKGSKTANQSDKGKNMKFEFNGDDDVWVFVDGQLCLDIGGIHDMKSGSIDFTTGEVLYDMKDYDKGDLSDLHNTAAENFLRTQIQPGQNHTLTILYLERGSSLSNAHIYFNLTPSVTLGVYKLDEENGMVALQGAKFIMQNKGSGINKDKYYTGVNTSTKMAEWNTSDADRAKIITTDKNGKLSFSGVSEGTYLLREIMAPSNFQISLGDIPFTVIRNSQTNGLQAVLNNKISGVSIDENNQMTICVTNTHKDINVRLFKQDFFSGEALAGGSFDLYRTAPYNADKGSIVYNEKIVGEDGKQIALTKVGSYASGNDGMIFNGTIKAGICYYLIETQAPKGHDALVQPVKITIDEAMNRGVSGARVFCELIGTGNVEMDETYITAAEQKTEVIDGTTVTTYSYDIRIPNMDGYELPSTGGIGVGTVLRIGVFLVIGSGLLLILRHSRIK